MRLRGENGQGRRGIKTSNRPAALEHTRTRRGEFAALGSLSSYLQVSRVQPSTRVERTMHINAVFLGLSSLLLGSAWASVIDYIDQYPACGVSDRPQSAPPLGHEGAGDFYSLFLSLIPTPLASLPA